MSQKTPSQPPLTPFSCAFSPNLPELLQQLQCTIAISTYQAGKVIFLSPLNEDRLTQLPRNFNKAMGIAVKGNKMAVATRDAVLVFANSKELAYHYPKKPQTYDALYLPRATYHTSQLDIHDLDWGKDDAIFGVNTSFSCLVKIDHNYSFTPIWKPPFISKLSGDDRCHLNGMCLQNELPKYVTALGKGDMHRSWKPTITSGGIVMDIEQNTIIAENLAMPHSPRLIEGQLYVLLSASGQLVRIDVQSGEVEVVYDFKTFVRGLAYYKGFLFVGMSKIRKTASFFGSLPIAANAKQAGVAVLHLKTAALCGFIKYHNSVDEIYDVRILPNIIRPNILTPEKEIHKLGLSIPGKSYWGRKKEDKK